MLNFHFLEPREERKGPSESAAPSRHSGLVGFPLWKALLGDCRHAATSTEIQGVLQALGEAEPAATGSQNGTL